MKVTVKKLPKSEVEIEGELEAEIFESFFGKAVDKIGSSLEVDGFRKGKVPEPVILSKVPEMQILEQMATLALSEHYPKIVTEEKIDAIGRPQISITKLARKSPLGFKIKTAVLPEVLLPDYKNVAKKVLGKLTAEEKNAGVTDADVDNTIMDIRKSRAPKINVTDPEAQDKAKEETPELPELNDEFVKSIGPFQSVEDFISKLKENLRLEKENTVKEKIRIKILEAILAEAKIDVPEILIDSEVDKILYKMESDVAQMGLKFEDYLKHMNKSLEDLHKDFHGDGEKKAKAALILNEIAKAEKIAAEEEEVAKEVAHILEHYKDADPERARAHAENILTNEKIFRFLENQ